MSIPQPFVNVTKDAISLLANSDVLFIALNQRLIADENAVRQIEKTLALAFALDKQVYFILEEACDFEKTPFNLYPVFLRYPQRVDTSEGLAHFSSDVDGLLTQLETYLAVDVAPPPAPVGKAVLVVGTIGDAFSVTEHIASVAIGRALAGAGYALRSGGWQGVDRLTIEAYVAALNEKALAASDWLTQVLTAHQEPVVHQGKTVRIDGPKAWLKEAVGKAHAVIVIGGRTRALEIAEYAMRNAIPVLPIPRTGGNAKQIYQEISSIKPAYVTPDDLKRLNGKITDQQEADAIAAAIIAMLANIENNKAASPKAPKKPSPKQKKVAAKKRPVVKKAATARKK